MKYLLDAVFLATLAATSPYWVYQAIRTGKYRHGLAERFLGRAHPRGCLANCGGPRIWIHAVSVGEIVAAGALVRRLKDVLPGVDIVLTSTTQAGFEIARRRHPELAVHRCPLDFSWAVRRFFDAVRPEILVLVELELWPNLLLEARRRRIPVAVVNARMSARSHRGYRRVKRWLRPALEAVHWWGIQTREYADRIAELLPNSTARMEVTGSLKFDGALTDRANERIRSLGELFAIEKGDLVFVAGSTQPPEEEVLLDWWIRVAPVGRRKRLILAPRSPVRFDAVAEMLRRRGVDFRRRSQITEPDRCEIILLDTIGELNAAWGLADFGYVGGSLTPGRGGQSMIEPAALGVPVCFGPHTENFQEIVVQMVHRQAARQVTSADELCDVLSSWVDDPESAASVGRRARTFVLSQQGGVARTVEGLKRVLRAA